MEPALIQPAETAAQTRDHWPYIWGGLIVPAVGVLLYGLRAAVDIWRRRGEAGAKAEEAPIEVLRAALSSRDREISEGRTQMHAFMVGHLERDRQEHEKLIEVLTEQKETMKAIRDEMVQHRQEERERTASFHNRLNDIDKGIARIEGQSRAWMDDGHS